jgi:hypothetical protein
MLLFWTELLHRVPTDQATKENGVIHPKVHQAEIKLLI